MNQNALLDLVQAGKTDRYLRLRLIMFKVRYPSSTEAFSTFRKSW